MRRQLFHNPKGAKASHLLDLVGWASAARPPQPQITDEVATLASLMVKYLTKMGALWK